VRVDRELQRILSKQGQIKTKMELRLTQLKNKQKRVQIKDIKQELGIQDTLNREAEKEPDTQRLIEQGACWASDGSAHEVADMADLAYIAQ